MSSPAALNWRVQTPQALRASSDEIPADDQGIRTHFRSFYNLSAQTAGRVINGVWKLDREALMYGLEAEGSPTVSNEPPRIVLYYEPPNKPAEWDAWEPAPRWAYLKSHHSAASAAAPGGVMPGQTNMLDSSIAWGRMMRSGGAPRDWRAQLLTEPASQEYSTLYEVLTDDSGLKTSLGTFFDHQRDVLGKLGPELREFHHRVSFIPGPSFRANIPRFLSVLRHLEEFIAWSTCASPELTILGRFATFHTRSDWADLETRLVQAIDVLERRAANPASVEPLPIDDKYFALAVRWGGLSDPRRISVELRAAGQPNRAHVARWVMALVAYHLAHLNETRVRVGTADVMANPWELGTWQDQKPLLGDQAPRDSELHGRLLAMARGFHHRAGARAFRWVHPDRMALLWAMPLEPWTSRPGFPTEYVEVFEEMQRTYRDALLAATTPTAANLALQKACSTMLLPAVPEGDCAPADPDGVSIASLW